MKKVNNSTKRFFVFLSFSLLLGAILIISCGDDNPAGPGKSKLTCEAGCSSMGWNIEGETGFRTYTQSCTRTYTATGDYVERCTGTVTYDNSGKTYNFSATYDWPACKISVTVTGVGSCTDVVGTGKINPTDCNCDKTLLIDEMNVKFKEE